MAKRPAEDEEDEAPKVRKRRYNPPKKEDDDEDAPSPGKRGKQEDDDEDGDGEDSISTGNMYLDISLDFFDDCIDWSKAHLLYAIIIGTLSFLIFATLFFLFVSSWVRYLNRPTLESVIETYEQGLFPETKFRADEALRYIPVDRPDLRSPFLFLQGAAFCAIAEMIVPADRRDYYLTAANYLKEAAQYNFLPSRADEGWFLLGKSLYHCGEREQCRLPLRLALEEGYPHTKEIYWYLANAHFWGAPPELKLAREYLHRFQNEPTVLEEEIAESYLLETMIVLYLDDIPSAETIFTKAARFRKLNIQRLFVEGQIELFKARELRQQAINFETDPNPSLLQRTPVAPVQVEPESPTLPQPATSPMEVPTAPVQVLPMDEEALRELRVPGDFPAPVLGMFDDTSEIQQRFAEMRAIYANNAYDDEIIVVPRQDRRQAPVPPPPSPLEEEMTIDPFDGDPIKQQVAKYREDAAGHYQEAIAKFSEVVQLANLHDASERISRLLIGVCFLEMGDTKRANDLFRRLIDTFPLSHEAVAAGFLFGEQERIRGNNDAALRIFAQSFDVLRRTPNYASHWLPKEEIMERSAVIIRDDVEKRNHTDAVKLLNMLNGVMPADDLARLGGETYENWAAFLQSQADTIFGEQGEQLARDAELKWRSAGAAFAVLAQLYSDRMEFSELLWRSAENYRFGKDFRRAVNEYRKFARANMRARRPEVHLRLGEMYLNLNVLDEAAYVLEEAIRDFPAHYMIPQVRLVLSHVYSEQREWDKAVALLQLNLIGDAPPTSGTYRDSMFALGQISFLRGDLDAAIPYLEDAIKIHPDAIQAADANYTLAKVHLEQAEKSLNELAENPPEAVRRAIESIVQTNRNRTLFYLDQTEAILADRQQAMGLIEAEKLMLRNVQFLTCRVLMDMEKYDLAIPRLNAMATMYQDRSEALEALVKLAFCQQMTGKGTEAQRTLRRADVILSQLEKTGTVADGADWRNVIQGQMR